MTNSIPTWAQNILDQLDSVENKLDSLITGQASMGNDIPKRKVTPAITSRLKNEIITLDGKCLFQHMTRGPDKEWDKKRDIGLIVRYENFLAKIISSINTKNQITISIFAEINKEGEERELHTVKEKAVNSDSLKVPSLWPFSLLETALTESLEKDIKVCNSITKAPADLKIKLKINHIWQKVLVGDKYEKERKWLRKWTDKRTLDQPKKEIKESTVVKPTPKKSGGKKERTTPAKNSGKIDKKKENVVESASDQDCSSSEED